MDELRVEFFVHKVVVPSARQLVAVLAVVVIYAVDAKQLQVSRQAVGALVWAGEDVGYMLAFRRWWPGGVLAMSAEGAVGVVAFVGGGEGGVAGCFLAESAFLHG